jgi:p-aminobenzoyl-glutamate transporter AbgT
MKTHAFALATTTGLAYIACAIFDVLFPPYGMLVALAPHSPMPIYGSLLGFLTGFLMFTVTGFVFGAIYGTAWDFWSKKLS